MPGTFVSAPGIAGFQRFRVFVSLILLYGNFGDMVFHALVKAHLFRWNLQLFRMIHEMNDVEEEARIMRAGADPFIRRDADGQDALHPGFSVLYNRFLLDAAHTEEQADIAEVVDVVQGVVAVRWNRCW